MTGSYLTIEWANARVEERHRAAEEHRLFRQARQVRKAQTANHGALRLGSVLKMRVRVSKHNYLNPQAATGV